MPPLTTADLVRATLNGCQMPGCTHQVHGVTPIVYLHSRCHPSAGTWAGYHADQPGLLKIICKRCRALVCEVAVAAP